MSDQHVGVRRRPSRIPVRRVVPLAAGLVVVAWVLALGEPDRAPEGGSAPVVVPTWNGPATVDLPGVLSDGASYTPRLYLDGLTSVGVATAPDGTVRVVLARAPGSFTTLRPVPGAAPAQIHGFAAAGDTVVWMETVAGSAGTATTLWRSTLPGTSPATPITSNTGQATFYGVPTDAVIADGRVTWTALAAGQPARTEVRSVALAGGQVSTSSVDGELLVTTPPWAVSLPGGRGSTVTLVNLSTDQRLEVVTAPGEAAACDPAWCRLTVITEEGTVGIDLMRPDGSERRRIAGPEATPTAADTTLLGRYVPLATERADGVGLTIYDVTSDETLLVAQRAANVGGRGAVLWWSTGLGSQLTWHALDLSRLP